mgnify:FL=1
MKESAARGRSAGEVGRAEKGEEARVEPIHWDTWSGQSSVPLPGWRRKLTGNLVVKVTPRDNQAEEELRASSRKRRR